MKKKKVSTISRWYGRTAAEVGYGMVWREYIYISVVGVLCVCGGTIYTVAASASLFFKSSPSRQCAIYGNGMPLLYRESGTLTAHIYIEGMEGTPSISHLPDVFVTMQAKMFRISFSLVVWHKGGGGTG